MKKLLIFTFTLGMLTTAFSQEAEDKSFQAGIVIGGDININKPQTNTMDAKTGGDFLVGMTLDWNFTKNVGLSTGLEFDFNNFTSIYDKDTNNIYFDYDDKVITTKKDNEESEHTSFLLKDRTHNSIYATIPVMLKFQTNYLGYMRYYGKFGIRNSFLLTTSTKNRGERFDVDGKADGTDDLDGMKSKGVMNFYKGAIGIAGGAEYNITGTTVIGVELGFYYGFTEIFHQKRIFAKKENKHEYRSLYSRKLDENGKLLKKDYYSPQLKQHQLMLKLYVTF